MKNSYYLFLLLGISFSLSGCYEPLDEELVFFEGIDFDSGDYKIEVYGMEGEWIEDYQNFYIDDIATLNKMKRRWVFRHKADPMPCGYGYSLSLKKNYTKIKSVSINIDCEYMSGWVRFPRSYLEDYKYAFKRF